MILKTILILATCIAALYCLTLILSSLVVKADRLYTSDSRFYRWLLNSSTGIGLFLCRVRLRVTGMDKIPEGTRFLLVSNHRSKFDPLVTWYVFRKFNISFVSKPENFNIPFWGRIIRRCCFLPIDREDPRKALETIEAASQLIRNDTASVGIYPEGKRSKDEKLLPFHNGVLKIAQRAAVPVVVITVQGTEKIHKNYPWHASTVDLHVLSVIPAEEVTSSRTKTLGEKIYNQMAEDLRTSEERGDHEKHHSVQSACL